MIKYVIDNALLLTICGLIVLVLAYEAGMKREQALNDKRMDALCSPLQEGKRSSLCATWRGPADKVFRTNQG